LIKANNTNRELIKNLLFQDLFQERRNAYNMFASYRTEVNKLQKKEENIFHIGCVAAFVVPITSAVIGAQFAAANRNGSTINPILMSITILGISLQSCYFMHKSYVDKKLRIVKFDHDHWQDYYLNLTKLQYKYVPKLHIQGTDFIILHNKLSKQMNDILKQKLNLNHQPMDESNNKDEMDKWYNDEHKYQREHGYDQNKSF
jgi:hypothetical protein